MPCAFSRSAVLTELATAPLIRCLIFASSSMKKFAVEPEPTPIHRVVDDVLDRLAGDGLLLLVLGHRRRPPDSVDRESEHHPAHVGEQRARDRR